MDARATVGSGAEHVAFFAEPQAPSVVVGRSYEFECIDANGVFVEFVGRSFFGYTRLLV